MKTKRILVTSALPYANGPLHLGHIAGAYLPADIYVRYQRLIGSDIVYICGSDEHGVPITVTADKEGIAPQDVVDRFHGMNKSSFEDLGISFDNYSRTTLPIHHETAREFFTKLHNEGHLIVKESEQYFSESAQKFLPDRYVEGQCPHCQDEGARGDQCDNCGKWLEPGELLKPRSKMDGSVPVLKNTRHWYLPMGSFSKEWKEWFDSHEWPQNVRNYCLGWYKEGLGDRPITRDLNWGIDVPLEDANGKVLYVWFDAPIGYISSTKEWAQNKGQPEKWKEYWLDQETELVHFIGKDNIVFHAILFPMMLKEMGGYIRPTAIPANEYLTIEGRKISTSRNYAIWVKDYLQIFEPDPLRFTLAANAPETKDTDFSWKQLQSRNNDELADILGNFINRTMTFIHKYYDGIVPGKHALSDMDREMLAVLHDAPDTMAALFESFQVRKAVKAFMDICRSANKYFNDKAPWEARKNDLESCATTLTICVEIAQALATLMSPIVPFSSEKLLPMLGLTKPLDWNAIKSSDVKKGHKLGAPGILFPKIEDDVIQIEIEKLKAMAEPKIEFEAIADTIDFDQFKAVDLRTAKVIHAEKIKKANKLLRLEVDIAGEKRQIVAGIARSYKPEALIGKTILVVANLATVKIRGVESQGMVLALATGDNFTLLTPDGDMPSGIRVE
ncbi:methionine--tRNA ligase [bacterium]|nr:methionine--tRNA ligase [bacterium]